MPLTNWIDFYIIQTAGGCLVTSGDPITIDKLKEGLTILKMAKIYTHRIDGLLSGDDEYTFRSRLKEDLADRLKTDLARYNVGENE
jgi:hypothetical protein